MPAKAALNIRDRIKQIANQSAPSMTPGPREVPAPPRKQEETVPDISQFVKNSKTRLEIARLAAQYGGIAAQKSKLEKEHKAVGERLKVLAGEYKVDKAVAGEWRISYYSMFRSSLDRDKLLQAGVPVKTLVDCTVTKESYALRVSPVGQEEEVENHGGAA